MLLDKNTANDLAFAVITQAIEDYRKGSTNESYHAKQFLFSEDLEFWSDFLNISAAALRDKIDTIKWRRPHNSVKLEGRRKQVV